MEKIFFDEENAELPEDAVSALKKFDEILPTENDCMEYLLSHLLNQGNCRKCQSQNIVRQQKSRDYRCNNCGETASLTAGTLYTGIKKAGPFLKIIYLLERGIYFNCFQIHKLIGVAYSTCLTLVKKISMVIMKEMEEFSRLINSAVFLSVFKKRSRVTPAKEHPQSEQRAAEEALRTELNKLAKEITNQNDINNGNGREKRKEQEQEQEQEQELVMLNDAENKVFSIIKSGKIHLDNIIQQAQLSYHDLIMPLFNLEQMNLIERHPADYYACKIIVPPECSSRSGLAYSRKTKGQVKEFVDFISKKIDGISRKYLQNYLAIFWCLKDKLVWGKDKLFQACLKSPEIPYHQIISYETPLDVTFAFVE